MLKQACFIHNPKKSHGQPEQARSWGSVDTAERTRDRTPISPARGGLRSPLRHTQTLTRLSPFQKRM